jgi:hypothetical protein
VKRDLRAIALVVASSLLIALTAVGVDAALRAGDEPATEAREKIKGCIPEPDADVQVRLNDIKMMNYAPVSQAQSNMWSAWDSKTVDRDFAAMAEMNVNTVRLFLYVPVSGYPQPSRQYMDKLHDAISLAENHCLRVQLTLFAFFNAWTDMSGSKAWARAVLAPYANDRRIAFIELFNEVDTDNKSAMAWAKGMAPYVRGVAGDIPVTLSVSGSEGLDGLRRIRDAGLQLDFIDLHYYDKPEMARDTFARAKQLSAPLPLFIGETGSPSRAMHVDEGAWWECYQSQYLRTVELATQDLKLPAAAPWTFNDSVWGAFPPDSSSAQADIEYHLGLRYPDGSPKPAAAAMAAFYGGQTPDESFNNSFESGGQTPGCWLTWQTDHASFALDRAVSRTGSASARISSSKSSFLGLPAWYATPSKPIHGGVSYTASVYARGLEATGQTRMALAWFDSNSRFLGNDGSSSMANGTSDWQLLTLHAVAPREAAYVQIHLVSTNNTGTVWFDDVTFD